MYLFDDTISAKITTKMVKRQKRQQDEEITSEDEEHSSNSDDFFEPTETPEEARIRMAKSLISSLPDAADALSKSHVIST